MGKESLPEENPVDALFIRIGLPGDFGSTVINYHNRSIEARDYFNQPDVSPHAKLVYNALSHMPEDDPRFPALKEAFMAGIIQFVGDVDS